MTIKFDKTTISSGSRMGRNDVVVHVCPHKITRGMERNQYFPKSQEELHRHANDKSHYNHGPAKQMVSRQQRLKEFGKPWSMSEVGLTDDKKVNFTNGRNRFMLARDHGHKSVPVAVHKDQAEHFKKHYSPDVNESALANKIFEGFIDDADKRRWKEQKDQENSEKVLRKRIGRPPRRVGGKRKNITNWLINKSDQEKIADHAGKIVADLVFGREKEKKNRIQEDGEAPPTNAVGNDAVDNYDPLLGSGTGKPKNKKRLALFKRMMAALTTMRQ